MFLKTIDILRKTVSPGVKNNRPKAKQTNKLFNCFVTYKTNKTDEKS